MKRLFFQNTENKIKKYVDSIIKSHTEGNDFIIPMLCLRYSKIKIYFMHFVFKIINFKYYVYSKLYQDYFLRKEFYINLNDEEQILILKNNLAYIYSDFLPFVVKGTGKIVKKMDRNSSKYSELNFSKIDNYIKLNFNFIKLKASVNSEILKIKMLSKQIERFIYDFYKDNINEPVKPR